MEVICSAAFAECISLYFFFEILYSTSCNHSRQIELFGGYLIKSHYRQFLVARLLSGAPFTNMV